MHTVLTVDDHPEIRQLLRVVLESHAFIVEAANGVDALELIAKHRPSIVLLDGMMQDMDGLEVLAAIRANPETRHIKVAMLSARGQEKDLLAAADQKVDRYFTKPFSPLEVAGWVKQQLVQE
jgi:CheY-like chemotaxis protein